MLAAFATAAGGAQPLDNLTVGEREMPVPGPGAVRLRTRAASLNRHDLWTLAGVGPPSSFPWTLGCDVAGIVDAYGSDTPERLPLGAPVVAHAVITCGVCDACLGPDETSCRKFAMLSEGSWEGTFGEYCLVPAMNLFPLPADLNFEQAACLPTAYLTAYRMLFTKAALRPGNTVLIQGAGGGLSTAAEALGLAGGLRVIVTSRDPAKRAAAIARGAHHAVATGREAVGEVLGLTAGEGVDAVVESVGEATWATSLRVLRRGGTLVVAGATTGADPPADLRRVFWRQLRILGSTMGTWAEFSALLGTVQSTGMRPLIEQTYPLADAHSAFRRLEAGDVTGKLVLISG
ncbi:MAG TPA: zinc-binding dehydrogenase [Candidatus Micrarchaeaceae archaeon]|nr:zinc-binding dehydrogenase [Candidatus Micrarchaeaceae archaeon]HVB13261.1 zinc-binding dehydrogenase [Candidatus Dormibacteraeota bacterium]